jgi:hypothetical protein
MWDTYFGKTNQYQWEQSEWEEWTIDLHSKIVAVHAMPHKSHETPRIAKIFEKSARNTNDNSEMTKFELKIAKQRAAYDRNWA